MCGILFHHKCIFLKGRKIMRKILLSSILLWICCIGYGALVGMLSSTSAKYPESRLENISYQNFAIYAGAITGVSICFLTNVVYWLTKKRLVKHQNGFVFLLSVITGSLIGLLASLIVHTSAYKYGMINANIAIIIIGTLVPAVIGGLIPAIALLIVKS